jgi:hypothetical protein
MCSPIRSNLANFRSLKDPFVELQVFACLLRSDKIQFLQRPALNEFAYHDRTVSPRQQSNQDLICLLSHPHRPRVLKGPAN